MTPKKLIPYILGLAIILVGAFAYSQRTAAPVETPDNSNQQDAGTDITEIDTSDWQTYTNEENGVSLKFHPFWEPSHGDIGVYPGNEHFLYDYNGYNYRDLVTKRYSAAALTIAIINPKTDDRDSGILGEFIETIKKSDNSIDIYSRIYNQEYTITSILRLESGINLVASIGQIEDRETALVLLNDILETIKVKLLV